MTKTMTDLAPYQQRINTFLNRHLAQLTHTPESLREAIQYSLLNGGKRFRACLVYGAAEITGQDVSRADPIAAAVECIHAYSLVHDDLPAMDDSDLRRGQPSCHMAFDEATAILVGDSLQAMAFRLLSEADAQIADGQRLKMIRCLADACGPNGMVGGQVLDLAFAGSATHTYDEIEHMHALKTTALIHAAVQLGAFITDGLDDTALGVLKQYSDAVGLGFQIRDDILDACASTETMGKPQGLDQQQQKSTYVTLLGLAAAKARCDTLLTTALACLDDIPGNTHTLALLARLAIERRY